MSVLADLLARESEAVRAFIASLTEEQEALKRGETDVVAAIALKKSQQIEQLNAAEKERNALLQEAGYRGDTDGMKTWLATNGNDRGVAEGWTQLMELAAQAKRINDLNGRLIAIRLQAANQAIGILTEQHQRSSLYGRDGFSTPRTGSRIIDAA
ncbi:MAG TPA: flagellar protein FlgN [Rhodocyclaceae bacterium]|nr:flagellar protein FlgN [Rhodocyclaceae bacterium]